MEVTIKVSEEIHQSNNQKFEILNTNTNDLKKSSNTSW